MTEHAYLTLDVFTSQAFGGNQLAVFPDARGLDSATMQSIATEFNFSETTFVLPPPAASKCIAEVRIFTPTRELPFAGHPNVGTAFALAQMGELPGQETGDRFVFHEKAGEVDCRITREDGEVVSASIAAPAPLTVGAEVDRATVAACASLDEHEIETTRHAPHFVSVGMTFVAVELGSLEALAKARGNATEFVTAQERYSHPDGFSLFVYTRVDGDPRHLRARMFAPNMNIAEDPATGSACAAVAAFLARLDGADSADFLIEQGVEMGRPSRLDLTVRGSEVRVGGPCVVMMQGRLTLR